MTEAVIAEHEHETEAPLPPLATASTPQTLEEIFTNNDVQLFDLESDPDEMHNLAVEPEKNRATILRMNGLLNELMAKEVGVNDGRFLPQDIRPK